MTTEIERVLRARRIRRERRAVIVAFALVLGVIAALAWALHIATGCRTEPERLSAAYAPSVDAASPDSAEDASATDAGPLATKSCPFGQPRRSATVWAAVDVSASMGDRRRAAFEAVAKIAQQLAYDWTGSAMGLITAPASGLGGDGHFEVNVALGDPLRVSASALALAYEQPTGSTEPMMDAAVFACITAPPANRDRRLVLIFDDEAPPVGRLTASDAMAACAARSFEVYAWTDLDAEPRYAPLAVGLLPNVNGWEPEPIAVLGDPCAGSL